MRYNYRGSLFTHVNKIEQNNWSIDEDAAHPETRSERYPKAWLMLRTSVSNQQRDEGGREISV